MKKIIFAVLAFFGSLIPLAANEYGSSIRFAFDAGEMVQNFFIYDCGFYAPLEVQYHFGNVPLALMGGITLSTHKSCSFDIGLSTGVRWYTYTLPEKTIGNPEIRDGIFVELYPLYEISPFTSVSEKRFVWNSMLGGGWSVAWTKHFFTDASVGWIFSDIPNGAWYAGGIALSLKLGFILPM